MHLFNDIFQSICNDLNEIGEEINDFLGYDFYLTFQPRKGCNDILLSTLTDYNTIRCQSLLQSW
jgi:hypothetical protein